MVPTTIDQYCVSTSAAKPTESAMDMADFYDDDYMDDDDDCDEDDHFYDNDDDSGNGDES